MRMEFRTDKPQLDRKVVNKNGSEIRNIRGIAAVSIKIIGMNHCAERFWMCCWGRK